MRRNNTAGTEAPAACWTLASLTLPSSFLAFNSRHEACCFKRNMAGSSSLIFIGLPFARTLAVCPWLRLPLQIWWAASYEDSTAEQKVFHSSSLVVFGGMGTCCHALAMALSQSFWGICSGRNKLRVGTCLKLCTHSWLY